MVRNPIRKTRIGFMKQAFLMYLEKRQFQNKTYEVIGKCQPIAFKNSQCTFIRTVETGQVLQGRSLWKARSA